MFHYLNWQRSHLPHRRVLRAFSNVSLEDNQDLACEYLMSFSARITLYKSFRIVMHLFEKQGMTQFIVHVAAVPKGSLIWISQYLQQSVYRLQSNRGKDSSKFSNLIHESHFWWLAGVSVIRRATVFKILIIIWNVALKTTVKESKFCTQIKGKFGCQHYTLRNLRVQSLTVVLWWKCDKLPDWYHWKNNVYL